MSNETKVLVCRPVDWADKGLNSDQIAAYVAQIHAATGDKPGHDPLTGVYPDSTVHRCVMCNVRCWVGPRQTEQLGQGALVLCPICVFEVQKQGATRWSTLGNEDIARRPDSAFGGS